MSNKRWRTTAIALSGLMLLGGCRTYPDRTADTYLLKEVVFLDGKSASAAVEAECAFPPLLEKALLDMAVKRGMTLTKAGADTAIPASANTLSVTIDEVVGARHGNILGPNWVVSEVFTTVSVVDAKGAREAEIMCRAGLGRNPLGNLTVCDRVQRCADELSHKALSWVQRPWRRAKPPSGME